MSEMILGIDLGTTNSAVGVVDSGFSIPQAIEHGGRITAWKPGDCLRLFGI